jgi:hypothetical protein
MTFSNLEISRFRSSYGLPSLHSLRCPSLVKNVVNDVDDDVIHVIHVILVFTITTTTTNYDYYNIIILFINTCVSWQ